MNSSGSGISEILIMALDLAWWVVIIQFIMSWLVQFNVLNLRQPIVAQAWFGINRLTSASGSSTPDAKHIIAPPVAPFGNPSLGLRPTSTNRVNTN